MGIARAGNGRCPRVPERQLSAIVELEQVADVLDVGAGSLTALVGGGGKTTLLFALGHQLRGQTLLTTTTRMARDRTGGFPVVVNPTTSVLAATLQADCSVLVWRSVDEHKAAGFPPETVAEWHAARVADHIVVEADGAGRRPFTAPATHEPPIPVTATLVVACIGAGAIDEPIGARCHRPELVAALAGCRVEDRLTPSRAARVLLHRDGLRRHVPTTARFVVAVVGADGGASSTELVDVLEAHGSPVIAIARADDPW